MWDTRTHISRKVAEIRLVTGEKFRDKIGVHKQKVGREILKTTTKKEQNSHNAIVITASAETAAPLGRNSANWSTHKDQERTLFRVASAGGMRKELEHTRT